MSMLVHTLLTDGSHKWEGEFHGKPLTLFVEPDPEFPPFWRWRRDNVQQTCMSESEAIRWAFDGLQSWRWRES